MPLHRSRQITVAIAQPLDMVYLFLAKPENFPRWASGLGEAFEPAGDGLWGAQTPNGPVHIRFTPQNDYGVLDHHVIPPEGDPVYMPMRVYANGTGCEVVVTVFRLPDMRLEDFERDAEWVQNDLLALKTLLEES
jgi:hypothetical protein